jgi:hypothetical protein
VGRLLYEAKINSESVLHCGKFQVQQGCKLSDCQALVLLGGDGSHNIIGMLGFFAVRMALLRCRFPLFFTWPL